MFTKESSVASLDFDKEKNIFREYHTDNLRMLEGAAKLFESLVGSLTSNVDGLESPTVSSRLKDREECIKKFARKYQTQLETNKTPYEIRGHITDLIGLRIVCYYETDIAKVVQILRDNFSVIDETDKSAELESQENVFGYKGHHLDLRINDDRADLPEYRRYRDLRFEVQVRSTIQDAWSVLDHKIKYKKSIPHSLRRQINALAALFEIADREFTNIKDLTEELKEDKAEKVRSDSSGPSSPLDVFEFLAVGETHFAGHQFQGFKADGFVQEINRWDPEMDANSFKQAMNSSMPIVQEYVQYQEKENGNELNPYTQIRHALYLSNKDKFMLVLYDHQRKNFDTWLDDQQPET